MCAARRLKARHKTNENKKKAFVPTFNQHAKSVGLSVPKLQKLLRERLPEVLSADAVAAMARVSAIADEPRAMSSTNQQLQHSWQSEKVGGSTSWTPMPTAWWCRTGPCDGAPKSWLRLPHGLEKDDVPRRRERRGTCGCGPCSTTYYAESHI